MKEVLRHLAYLTGCPEILDSRRQKKGLKITHLQSQSAAKRFQAIYKENVWVHEDGQEAQSGLGSVMSATSGVRSELASVINAIACGKLVDVGCGDWTWMRHVDLGCEYIGIDIVPEVIEANRRFETPTVKFLQLDAIVEPLPKADAVLCREVLFHLSFEDGIKVLQNIRKSADWLLATTDNLWFNSNIRTGDFRCINLCRPPYRLPEPELTIADDSVTPGRRLALWEASQIPS